MPETVETVKRPVGRPRRNASQMLVRQLKQEGWSFRRIASATGLGYGTVRRAYSGGQARPFFPISPEGENTVENTRQQ